MKVRWLLPLLCLGLVFLAACGPQVTPTPKGPPTSAPRTDVAQTPAADPFGRPEATVQGELEGGVPFGITSNGHYFKGDPDAPVLFFEFSDYQ